VDHHGTKIFDVDVSSDDVSEHVIRPYDPHHFLHHLVHKDQSREQGQRAPEEPAYYERIADAVAPGGKIVVVGHGAGKSNAAHHLTEYLQSRKRSAVATLRGAEHVAPDVVHDGGRCDGGPAVGRKERSYE